MYCLGQQDTVGHELDSGLRRCLIVKADLIADNIPERPKLITDTTGDGSCRHPAGLRAADNKTAVREGLKAEFGKLGGLPGTGVAGNDDNLFCF